MLNQTRVHLRTRTYFLGIDTEVYQTSTGYGWNRIVLIVNYDGRWSDLKTQEVARFIDANREALKLRTSPRAEEFMWDHVGPAMVTESRHYREQIRLFIEPNSGSAITLVPLSGNVHSIAI